MKIKRFKATDMRQAIKMVREEHGADAVILSNRKLKDGIEIISAIDYDESALDKIISQGSYESDDKPVTRTAQQNKQVAPSVAGLASEFDGYTSPSTNITDNGEYVAAESDDSVVSFDEKHEKQTTVLPLGGAAPKNASGQAYQSVNSTSSHLTPDNSKHKRELEMVGMQRELDTLKGLLNTRFSQPSQVSIPHVHPLHSSIFTRLSELGVRSELCQEVIQLLPLSSEVNEGWRKALAVLAHKIQVVEQDIIETGGVVALVGPSGVGKTTTIAKLAARFALKHGRDKVAIISTDSHRIAAQDQILSYGQMLGVPVYFASNAEQFTTVLGDLYEKHLVLIDTAGIGQRDKKINEQIDLLKTIPYQLNTYLVIAANTQELATSQIVKAYAKYELSGCVITKIDEAASLGGLLSVLVKWQIPVAYVSEGQRVPEDIQRARPYSLVSKSVTMVQQSELVTNGNYNTPSSHEGIVNAQST